MKKKLTMPANYSQAKNPPEPEEAFIPIAFNKHLRILPSITKFTYADFKKIAENMPFTHAEWSSILHVSERTLQRYAKNNSSFAPINAERAVQISNLINRGIEVFGDSEKFYHWLKRAPYMLEGIISIQSLTSQEGINMVLNQLGRIEHGLFA
jgi:putative toxin-antitoxin system antitoxin component (TIGR02293 family)